MIKKAKGQSLNNPAYLNICRVCIFSLAFILISQISWSQSKLVTDLKKDNLTSMSLYFYPSTLRMANLDNNAEFNRLIQDIDKLIFYKMNRKFEAIDFYNLYQNLQAKNNFEDYVVIDGPKQKIYLLGRESPVETVGLVLVKNEHYVFDIAGSLDLAELPKLYEHIANNDSTFQSKFSQLLNMVEIGQDIADDNH